jgi:hypothetical protein
MRVLMIAALSGLALGLGVNQTFAADAGAPAVLHVLLPADATLTIDGEKTMSTSAERQFETPALEPGKIYLCTRSRPSSFATAQPSDWNGRFACVRACRPT